MAGLIAGAESYLVAEPHTRTTRDPAWSARAMTAILTASPRVDTEQERLGALLVAAGLGPPADHALISLLVLNGLRVPEATGANIEALGVERGHRTLVITRKGGKVVTIPLAPRTARAIDLAVGERSEGPVFLAADARRLDRHGAAQIVRRLARRAGITKQVGPHTLRHAFITAALDAGVPLRDVQEAASHADPRTTMRYDRARTSLDRLHRRRLCRWCRPVTRRKDHLPGQHRPGRRPLQLPGDHRAPPANRKPRGWGGTRRSPGPVRRPLYS
jgi:integrase